MLDELQHVDHVVGIAQHGTSSNEPLTVFLDEEDAAARAEVRRWSEAHTTRVDIKVVGKIIL